MVVPSKKTKKSSGKTLINALLFVMHFLVKNGYLVLYNAVSWVGWTYVLAQTVSELAKNQGDYTKSYDNIGVILKWVQTTALLEVLHVVTGLVKSPIMTTIIQVTSRLFLVWGVVDLFPEVRTHLAFTTMTIAWSVTESIRYAYYGFSLLNIQPALILWARYTFFFILYPLGAGSEAILVYQSLAYSKGYNHTYYLVEIFALLTYPPGELLVVLLHVLLF
ncbi:8718_t:CDS:2 [Ambispora leptoticha]|uniref:Very-long-chain (3R)-3-hydroxyacyl-CoA dehydratase n=1 Tax=Ambispora leptoticha TaxID=144679 RepID=A0A9N8V3R8_9GLOM|nr:8718_t:CDS:2 [Ambispora leptoticha]